MGDYERRLSKLEQQAEQATFGDTQNMILVYLDAGEDGAAKIAEAKRVHGLAENDSGRILVIQFVDASGNGREKALT